MSPGELSFSEPNLPGETSFSEMFPGELSFSEPTYQCSLGN